MRQRPGFWSGVRFPGVGHHQRGRPESASSSRPARQYQSDRRRFNDVTVTGRKLINATGARTPTAPTGKPRWDYPPGDRWWCGTNQVRVRSNQRVSDRFGVTVPRGLAVESRGAAGDTEVATPGRCRNQQQSGECAIESGRNVRLDVSQAT